MASIVVAIGVAVIGAVWIYRSYRDQWNIQRTALQLQKQIGEGNFGKVWSGLLNGTTPVAIKALRKGAMEVEDFIREAELMKNLHHPNVIQLYGVCTPEPIYIVMEKMKHGNLLQYLRGEGRYIHNHRILTQIAEGMAYLEKHNYIHRDLAARNVLVGEGCICKISDFGLARAIKGYVYDASEGTVFPVKWTAPEAALYNRYSSKSDVWSFGVLISEVATKGANPYPDVIQGQLIYWLQQGYRMPQPQGCSNNLYNIMLLCWKSDPNQRPTFEVLKGKSYY